MGARDHFKNRACLINFLMIVFLFFGTNTLKGQPNNSNMLNELSKINSKVYIMVENIDSVPNFYQTVEKQIANLGYWKMSKNMNDADMVLIFTGFKIGINGYPHFECYVKIFDNKMNFIYRGEYLWKSWNTFEIAFDKTINALVKDLPNTLRYAKISKTSPFYVSSTEAMKYDEIKFSEYYLKLLESIEDKQNNKILENINRCILINPELPELYEIKARVLLEINVKGPIVPKNSEKAKRREPFNTIGKLIEFEPLNSNVDYLWKYARMQASDRGVEIINKNLRQAAILNAVSTSLNASLTSYAAIKTSSTATPSIATSSSNSSQISGKKGSLKKVNCTFCNGTGVNPGGTSGGLGIMDRDKWCDVCKSWQTAGHYHGSCPSCNGKGYKLIYSQD